MALTGLEIFKLLPNKNCRECGVPTCLAFAMKLAAKSADPALCPYISKESIEILGSSQSPPIKKLVFKAGGSAFETGSETVMYRHEKTFVNKTLIALEVSDSLPESEFKSRVENIKSAVFERVGEKLFPEGISLVFESGIKETYLKCYKELQSLDKIIVLSGITPEILKEIISIESNFSRLAVNSLRMETLDNFKDYLVNKDIKVVLEADDADKLFELVIKAEGSGLKNLILKLKSGSIAGLLENNISLRRLALKKGFKPAGYPVISECADELFTAITGICKYSSILILKKYDASSLFPLLTLRQNIYTDPQKPLQIQPGIYNIGEPSGASPLLVSTNFSLTYFIVSGEVENSPYSARLLVTDSEGMSVLTAWSANKFSADLIAKGIAGSNIEDIISHRKLIIPGFTAILKGDLEDKLKGWEIMVGPQEASDIPQYLKEVWK